MTPPSGSTASSGETRKERAVALFHSGHNCAQAVLCAFASSMDLQGETALSLSAGFGGGLARNGEACGAVTGAVMVLGLATGRELNHTGEAKELTYERVGLFLDRFRREHGDLTCRHLTGCDLTTPQGRAAADAKNLHDTLCAGLVRRAVELVEGLL